MIEHLHLKKIENLTPSATLMADNNNHKIIKINHPSFNAAFALHGAHLLHFQVKQQQPLIYLSNTAIFNGEKAIRGGVPVCWPWFGAANKSLGDNLPAHGFARTSQWRLSSINENDKGVDLEFSLTSNESTKAIWDHEFTLTLKASLSDQIELSLITENSGDKDFTYGGALHTYLSIGNAEQTDINGLASIYNDSLDGDAVKESHCPLVINKPIDSIYQTNIGSLTVNDTGNKRHISVTNAGNDAVVVWNPWIEGASAFIDLPDDGYKSMLCVESAITSQEGELVKAGQCHTLTTVIR